MACAICKIQCVGEKEDTLNAGCRGHESNIKNLTDNSVSNHYASYNHIIEEYMMCTWMILLDTLSP